MHYLTGHESTLRRIHHRLGFVWSRTTPGWGKPIDLSCAFLACKRQWGGAVFALGMVGALYLGV